MWLRHSIADLLETLAAAAPDSAEALGRIRGELLDLLVALLRPAGGAADAVLRMELAREVDCAIAERLGRRMLVPTPA